MKSRIQVVATLVVTTVVATLLALAIGVGSASAVVYHIGGSDALSDYTWDGSNGLFSFANDPIGPDPNLPGFVSSDDIPGSNLTNVDGSGGLAQVAFNIILGANQNLGAGNGSPFVPTATNGTGNIKKAQFLGGPTVADMIIYKPTGGDLNAIDEILLTFNITFIDITNATKKLVDPLPPFGVIDPDGSITFGDATESAITSLLTVSGGSLAPLVGGIGAEARLSILISTLTPPILTSSDFRGFFGADWTSGVGAEPIAGLAFDLLIIEPVVVAPEPATGLLLTLSLLGLGTYGRLRRRS